MPSHAFARARRWILEGLAVAILVSAGFFFRDFRPSANEAEPQYQINDRQAIIAGIRVAIEDRIESIQKAFLTTLDILESKNPDNDILPPIRRELLRQCGQIEILLRDLEQLVSEEP